MMKTMMLPFVSTWASTAERLSASWTKLPQSTASWTSASTSNNSVCVCVRRQEAITIPFTRRDFGLYNTPVLDFIQFIQGRSGQERIVIMCEDRAYANGLKATLDGLSENVLVFHTSAAVRSALGKKKPAVWVVTEDITRQPDQPWRADKTTPVILLSYCKAADTPIQKVDGKLTILTMPVLPKTLRDAVLSHIR